jgi:hypothetical protein
MGGRPFFGERVGVEYPFFQPGERKYLHIRLFLPLCESEDAYILKNRSKQAFGVA